MRVEGVSPPLVIQSRSVSTYGPRPAAAATVPGNLLENQILFPHRGGSGLVGRRPAKLKVAGLIPG